MLREWFRGSSAEPEKATAEKSNQRMVVDPEKPLETAESRAERRRQAFEKKLAETTKEGPPSPNHLVSYDSLFRRAQTILLEGNNNEVQQGITLNVGRNVQNTMISSKWSFLNPQQSAWEINLQMNGFTDIIGASWSTLNRYQLMYQRSSSTGAMLVTQFMAQKQQGMCQGMLFGMLQYPWVSGGCTQVQYVKDQSFGLSHVQRVIRGVHVGTNLNVDPTTHASTLSYAMSLMNPKKDAGFMAEMTPSKGTWKVAATKFMWSQNMDNAIELEYKEGREGMTTSLNVGCRKNYVGGAQLLAALKGFHTLKVNLTLPFGGSIPGMNQLRVLLDCEYDVHTGGLKQGLVFTA